MIFGRPVSFIFHDMNWKSVWRYDAGKSDKYKPILRLPLRVYISLSPACYRYACRIHMVTAVIRRVFTRKYEWATTAPQYEHNRNYKLQNQKMKCRNQGKFQNQTTKMHTMMYCCTIIPDHSIMEDANCKSVKHHIKLQLKCFIIELSPKYCSIYVQSLIWTLLLDTFCSILWFC